MRLFVRLILFVLSVTLFILGTKKDSNMLLFVSTLSSIIGIFLAD